MESAVHFGALTIDDEGVVFDVYDELGEHRAEQVTTDMVRHSVVKLDRVLQHFDVGEDEFGAVVESLLCLHKLLLNDPLLQGDLLESLTQFVDSHRAVRGEFD